jgi:hypothetical protein
MRIGLSDPRENKSLKVYSLSMFSRALTYTACLFVRIEFFGFHNYSSSNNSHREQIYVRQPHGLSLRQGTTLLSC